MQEANADARSNCRRTFVIVNLVVLFFALSAILAVMAGARDATPSSLAPVFSAQVPSPSSMMSDEDESSTTAAPSPRPAAAAATPGMPAVRRPLILISLDGFASRYLKDDAFAKSHRVLDKIAQRGVHASGMRPSFPSKTFPNHYTLVTGLRPGTHGVVANTMYDRALNATFHVGNIDTRFWKYEPVWLSLQRQRRDVHSACVFWPGCDTPIDGEQPTFWLPFDGSMTPTARVQQGLQWLQETASSTLPSPSSSASPASSPTSSGLLVLYFNGVDSQGHRYGPQQGRPEIAETMRGIDDALDVLLTTLDGAEDIDANIVIVSDHGMTGLSNTRVINMGNMHPEWEALVVSGGIRVVDTGVLTQVFSGTTLDLELNANGTFERTPENAAQWDENERVKSLLEAMSPHWTVLWRHELHAEWEYQNFADRIPPLLAVADLGYISTLNSDTTPRQGTHGYDPHYPDMSAIFFAAGPNIRHLPDPLAEIDNIDVYPLLCRLLGITPNPHSGTRSLVDRIWQP